MAKTVAVLGARNLGGAIIEHFMELGWNAAGVARSDDTVAHVRERGALGLDADASDPESLGTALADVRSHFGSLDAVVNAVSESRVIGGPFGGGELADADLAAFDSWTVAVAKQAFVFLSTGIAALEQNEGGGALVQITGGSSRRAMPGRGLWAAGAFATRALVQAAAQEMRAAGIHVALLAVDATIQSPKTEVFTQGTAEGALAEMGEIAKAVAYLVEQGVRAYTHEMVVTPAGERWVP
jgi:NADP-dependent 3-hydroxy acid dehydrogenase YdfG